MVEASEERPIIASAAIEEPATSGVDATIAKFEEERPLGVAKQEVVAEMAPLTDVSYSQVDEGGPSGTISSPITEIVQKCVQMPLGGSSDIASLSGTVPELPTSCSDEIPELVTVPILSVIVP